MVQSATRCEKPAHVRMLEELFEPSQSQICLFPDGGEIRCRFEIFQLLVTSLK